MLKKLQERWKVNGLNLILVISTFALGGSLCGWAGRKLLLMLGVEKGFLWVVSYIIVMTILWPFCVLLLSIPLGQFGFFKRYISKIIHKMSGKPKSAEPLLRIAVFASGAGSNANKIIEYFNDGLQAGKVSLVVCNKAGAGVLDIAKENNIPTLLINKDRLQLDGYLPELQKAGIELVVLAGFLWKLPPVLIQAFPKKIINIHPALLPKYGGKGMYGKHVHEAVIANAETESGISIHFADELYDHGEIIFQSTCKIVPADTPESLAAKIHVLEHTHYPRVIAEVLQKQNRS